MTGSSRSLSLTASSASTPLMVLAATASWKVVA
ncbi:Uncharacterised protein [Mycobacteroides abscessus subsp. abscessus]|nr:Uncharacterised protein [Mycobacteroides abscessus subsp. abscessus]